ncbi:hypothetical protein MN608_04647 [Microdochium nivale]|nr:hypothetical protein MN608_04647 [Microdochium nivale]
MASMFDPDRGKSSWAEDATNTRKWVKAYYYEAVTDIIMWWGLALSPVSFIQ